MSFGEKLELLRTKYHMNKKQLGQVVGVSADTISQYEKKDSVEGIDAAKLKKLADFFNISLDYLVTNDENIEQNIAKEKLSFFNQDVTEIQFEEFYLELKQFILNVEVTVKGFPNPNKKKILLDCVEIIKKIIENE